MRLEDVFANLSRVGTLSRATVVRYRTSLHALVRHGLVTTDDCTRERVAAVYDERLRTVTVKGANMDLTALVAILRYAARRTPELDARATEVGALRLDEPEPEPPIVYAEGEWRLVREAAREIRPWLPLALDLTVLAGLRRNEARTLHGEDIRLADRVLVVLRRATRRLKTRGSEREVSLCPELVEVLHAAQLPASGPIFPAQTRAALTPYVSMLAWQRAMRRLALATGVHATYGRGRRTFITWGLQSGVPQLEMERAAGHKDGAMMRRYYYAWRRGFVPAFDRFRPMAG